MNKDKKNAKLISVLGAGDYTTVNYDEFDKCEYIQGALVRKYKNELSQVVIFATEEAINTNWESNAKYKIYDKTLGIKKGDPKKGLKNKLQTIKDEYNLKIDIKMIKIPNGFSREELWDIFNKFIANIDEGDEIYFDITHGFRYLAMLVMNILNYVKLSKDIKVRRIEYGLFEILGNAFEVRNEPLKKRNANILNLTSFDYLNDFVIGVDNFINTGNPDKINKLSEPYIGKSLSEKGQDEKNYFLMEKIGRLVRNLKNFNDNLSTSRGKIINKNIIDILNLLEEIKNNDYKSNNRISPLMGLITKIERKFSIFDKDDKKGFKNYFALLKWCKEHNLIQQGYVIFIENMISLVADNLNEPYMSEHMSNKNYEYSLIDIRNEIANAIYSFAEEDNHIEPIISEEKFNMIKREIEENFIEFINIYNKFRYKRNDVSHFGLGDNATKNGQAIINKFSTHIDELEKLLEEKNYFQENIN